MWLFNKTYKAKEWEFVRWNYIKHSCEFGFSGWSVYFMLRNKKTRKQKVVTVGHSNWAYDTLWELNTAIFKKTGIEIIDQTAKLST